MPQYAIVIREEKELKSDAVPWNINKQSMTHLKNHTKESKNQIPLTNLAPNNKWRI